MSQEKESSDPIGFDDINDEQVPTEMESMCMNCHENGTTRMLLTKIPHFREVIIMAFSCPHCNWSNSEVQFGGSYQEQGVRFVVELTTPEDLNRQVVKSDSAIFSIPAIEFEVPEVAQKGTLNTVEGILRRAITDLENIVPEILKVDTEGGTKLMQFLPKLRSHADGECFPFTIVLEDPAGNSFVENPLAPKADPHMHVSRFTRTSEQNAALGLQEAPANATATESVPPSMSLLTPEEAEREFDKASLEREVLTLPAVCSSCGAPGEVRMVVTDIPHFKEIVLMAFNCDQCGYKSNEVKAGGPIPEKGKRVALRLENFPLDLNRDLLKSHTASFAIPELDLELAPGTLGGRFTTVEGLLRQVADELHSSQFVCGDSAETAQRERMSEFKEELNKPFTIILDDPLANSYVQNIYAPDDDPNMVVEEYERTAEQNSDLGITDMVTENYY